MYNSSTTYPGFSIAPLDTGLQQRIYGLSYHDNPYISYQDLRYLQILYCDFHGNTADGELICNRIIASTLIEIFYSLYNADYPIEKMHLIDDYQADDDLSCLDNNSSCFNYRTIDQTDRLSMHAYGLAIDINPFYNPYVTFVDQKEHVSLPGAEYYADRSKPLPYQINHQDLCYQLFTSHQFQWGGDWTHCKDYHHFEFHP